MIIGLKQIRYTVLLSTKKKKNLCTQVQCNNIMRKINPKCYNEGSFIYSILISLHYYDISQNPERITKVRAYTSNYDFTDTTANGFEMNNPHVSLEIIDEDRNIVYSPSNTTNNKAVVIKLKNNICCVKANKK